MKGIIFFVFGAVIGFLILFFSIGYVSYSFSGEPQATPEQLDLWDRIRTDTMNSIPEWLTYGKPRPYGIIEPPSGDYLYWKKEYQKGHSAGKYNSYFKWIDDCTKDWSEEDWKQRQVELENSINNSYRQISSQDITEIYELNERYSHNLNVISQKYSYGGYGTKKNDTSIPYEEWIKDPQQFRNNMMTFTDKILYGWHSIFNQKQRKNNSPSNILTTYTPPEYSSVEDLFRANPDLWKPPTTRSTTR